MNLSLRFDVLRRDEFCCQYCGARPPAVQLEVDHIVPRSKGGKDEYLNLITACLPCNRGKRTSNIVRLPLVQCADCEEWHTRPRGEEIFMLDGGHCWVCNPCYEADKAKAVLPA